MSEQICVVGSQFEGYCTACDGAYVTGVMETGEDKACINGVPICVTGSLGRGTCGHTTYAQGQSAVLLINDKQAARVGDPVQGTINGTLITGAEKATAD